MNKSSNQKLIKSELGKKPPQKIAVALVLAANDGRADSVREITQVAGILGAKWISKWNISRILSRNTDLFHQSTLGIELSDAAYSLLIHEEFLPASQPEAKVAERLRSQVQNLRNSLEIHEALGCYEHGFLKASVLYSWSSAISAIHRVLFNLYLAEVNTKGAARFKTWKAISTEDDFCKVKDSDLLFIACDVGLIGTNVRQMLEHALRFRNSACHPNSFIIGSHMVESHLEVLLLNVFSPLDGLY